MFRFWVYSILLVLFSFYCAIYVRKNADKFMTENCVAYCDARNGKYLGRTLWGCDCLMKN